jgi:transposase InsO family protein
LVGSLTTSAAVPKTAATVWSIPELRKALAPQATHWYNSYRVLSATLLGITGGLLWWFW